MGNKAPVITKATSHGAADVDLAGWSQAADFRGEVDSFALILSKKGQTVLQFGGKIRQERCLVA
jgi:hypothetical protein